MEKQENITAQSECTDKEWTAINIRFEYPDFQGKEKWIIATDLSEENLIAKYSDILKKYKPYVLVPCEFLQARNEYRTNEQFYYRFQVNHADAFPADDEVSASFHKELCCVDKEIDYEKVRAKKENKEEKAIEMIKIGMDMLTPIQKRRLVAVYFQGKSTREVAQEEGVHHSKIDKSIALALKKLKNFLETGGAKVDF